MWPGLKPPCLPEQEVYHAGYPCISCISCWFCFLDGDAFATNICRYSLPLQSRSSILVISGPHRRAPVGCDATKQRAWDAPLVESAVTSLLSSADDASKGRLLASKRKESGAWFSAPPVSSLGLQMDDDTVRIAVGKVANLAETRKKHLYQ